MLNHVTIIAKIHCIESKPGDKKYLLLDVQRPFKNHLGIYESDRIRCRLWGGIAETIERYYQAGDVVSICGRLESLNDHNSIIVAEEVDFLIKRKHPEVTNSPTQ